LWHICTRFGCGVVVVATVVVVVVVVGGEVVVVVVTSGDVVLVVVVIGVVVLVVVVIGEVVELVVVVIGLVELVVVVPGGAEVLVVVVSSRVPRLLLAPTAIVESTSDPHDVTIGIRIPAARPLSARFTISRRVTGFDGGIDICAGVRSCASFNCSSAS
jgi:hypothetical protein